MADPDQVLKQQATQLRAMIDSTAGRFPARERYLLGDEEGTCELPSRRGGWPRQWVYARRLFIEEPDSSTYVMQAVQQFEADGWSVRRDVSADQEVRYTVQKDGFVIGIDGGATGANWQLLGSSPCVHADGTVDRRTVT